MHELTMSDNIDDILDTMFEDFTEKGSSWALSDIYDLFCLTELK